MQSELIIKVDNQNIHLSSMLTVPIHQTNIPFEHCKFRDHEEICWRVQVMGYNNDSKHLSLKVIDYSPFETSSFANQSNNGHFERIAFEKFDWIKLEKQLRSFHLVKMRHMLYNADVNTLFKEEPYLKVKPEPTSNNFYTQFIEANIPQVPTEFKIFETAKREPKIETHFVEFKVRFSDAKFKDGYITFSQYFEGYVDKFEFEISNEFIRAEFETIKSWFAKKLKTKRFTVNATITTTDGKVTNYKATSAQIAQITDELIDSIKYQRTFELIKAPRVNEKNKVLYTAEEIFGQMVTESVEGNVFNQNEADILKILLGKNKTRNRKQLEYLSGYKQALNSKLRFTLHPLFGFLFFIEGSLNNHFVWELLNSHATYIWSIDKSQSEQELQSIKIEETINTIRDIGRDKYKKAYRQSHQDNELVFNVISHKVLTTGSTDGFVNWKNKLNEKLT